MVHEVIKFQDGIVYVSRYDTGFVSGLTVEYGGMVVKVDPSLGAIRFDGLGMAVSVHSDEVRKEELDAFEIFEEGIPVSSAKQVFDLIMKYMEDTIGVKLLKLPEEQKKE